MAHLIPYPIRATYRGMAALCSYTPSDATSVQQAQQKVKSMVLAWQQTALAATVDIACYFACKNLTVIVLTAGSVATGLAAVAAFIGVLFLSYFATEKLSTESARLAGSGLLMGMGMCILLFQTGSYLPMHVRILRIVQGLIPTLLGYQYLAQDPPSVIEMRILDGENRVSGEKKLFQRIAQYAANSWVKQTAAS